MRDITLADTFYAIFTTRAFATGIPTVLAGSPVVSAYENDSVTQITAGITLGVDHDGVVGLNLLTVVATGANGYEAGKDYSLVITTGTVGGVSVVGEVVGEFSVGRSAAAVDLANGTDGLGAIKAVLPSALVSGRMDSDVGAKTGNVALSAQEKLDVNVEADSALTDYGANTTTPPTVGAIADEHLNRALSGHQTQGTVGAAATMGAYAGRRGPGIYIDDAAANTGTTIGDDGTLENPVSTIAAASTLATNTGIHRFYLVNDTLITLAASYEGYEFIGIGLNNQVTLGTQDVDNAFFENLTLTGTQGGTGLLFAKNCTLTGLAAFESISENCWLLATNTLRASTSHMFTKCQSGIVGATTPILVFPGAGTTDLSFRHYSGGLEVQSAVGTNTMSFEADGQLIIAASCTSLIIVVRGNCSITDNGTTTDLTRDAAVTNPAVADDVWDEILTGSTHNLATSAGRRLRTLQDFGLYEGGGVWIDTVNGSAGTTDFENGTVNNPVNSIADARIIADSVGLKVFFTLPGSTFTFAQAFNDFEFIGQDYTVAFGGQSINQTLFRGATLSGTYSGDPHIEACVVNSITGPSADVHGSGLVGPITANGVGNWFFHHCYSQVAGTGTVTFDFGAAVGNTNINIRAWSGGLEFQNMGATVADVSSVEGWGQIILNANCVGGTLAIRGNLTLTDNAGGAVTVSDDARIDVGQIAAELETYDGPTRAEATSDKDEILSDTGEIGAAGAGLTAVAIGVGGIASTAFAAGAIDAAALNADAVDEILDETIGDGTITMRQVLKLAVAVLGGKLSGAATSTITIRNDADDTSVVVATVDVDGNRSAVTLTL